MLGSWIKHLMLMVFPSSSQPQCSTRSVRIISNVTPCKGFLGWMSLIVIYYETGVPESSTCGAGLTTCLPRPGSGRSRRWCTTLLPSRIPCLPRRPRGECPLPLWLWQTSATCPLFCSPFCRKYSRRFPNRCFTGGCLVSAW